MSQVRTRRNSRGYDLAKAGVLGVLLVALVFSWTRSRDESAPDLTGQDMIATPLATAIDGSVVIAPGEEISETGEEAEGEAATPEGGSETEPSAPAGDFPTIDVPPDNLAPGSTTLSGSAPPGSQVVILVDDKPVGTATAGVDGAWSLPAELVTGVRTVKTQVIDNLGNVISESVPLTIVVQPASDAGVETGTEATPQPPTGETGSTAATPEFDPATGTYRLSGTAAPGTMVTLSSGGTILGAVTADESGNWTAGVDPAVGSEVQVETLDVAGNVISSTVALPAVEDNQEAGADTSDTGTGGTAEATTEPQPASDYAPQSIAGLLNANPGEFSILMTALEATGLAEIFNGPDTFTLFAPTNDAFSQLPVEVTDGLVANPEALSQVLQYHATRGRYLAADLRIVAPSTLNNRLLTIVPEGDTLRVNDATVTQADIPADNGVIHVIDRVLVPPLAPGIRPPVVDESGVSTFTGPVLTVVGTAQPGSTILLELNDEPFGTKVTVDASGFWQVTGEVSPGEYRIVAYMLDANGTLQALSRAVNLTVQ